MIRIYVYLVCSRNFGYSHSWQNKINWGSHDKTMGKLRLENSCVFLDILTFDISNQDYLIYKWIHSLEYLRSTALGCKDIGIRKSEFVAKTKCQILCCLKVSGGQRGYLMNPVRHLVLMTLILYLGNQQTTR